MTAIAHPIAAPVGHPGKHASRGGLTLPRDIKSLVVAVNGQLKTLAGPTALYSAAAGQVPDGLGGVQASTSAPVHADGYYGGPAYTNLFTTAPTAAENKTLAAQVYCLQCVGGSVVGGVYGTATPSTPLVFTPTAASHTFTPTGCTGWMLTAGAYAYQIIPPGQSVVSTVGTTGGNGVSIPLTGSDKADRLIECFRGVPDGVELITNVADREFSSDTGWWTKGAGWTIAGGKASHVAGGDSYLQSILFFPGGGSAGDRFLLSFTVLDLVSGDFTIGGGNFTSSIISNGNGRKNIEVTQLGTSNRVLYITGGPGGATVFSLDDFSLMRLSPAVGTLAVLMKMGAGSAEIPNSTALNWLSVKDAASELLYSSIGASSEDNILLSNDGTTVATLGAATWNRTEYHHKIVEYGGGKFRVGNRRYTSAGVAIDGAIVWSHATLAGGANFDGSYDPTTFERLFLNQTTPNHMRCKWNSNLSGLGDTEIERRTRKYGKF